MFGTSIYNGNLLLSNFSHFLLLANLCPSHWLMVYTEQHWTGKRVKGATPMSRGDIMHMPDLNLCSLNKNKQWGLHCIQWFFKKRRSTLDTLIAQTSYPFVTILHELIPYSTYTHSVPECEKEAWYPFFSFNTPPDPPPPRKGYRSGAQDLLIVSPPVSLKVQLRSNFGKKISHQFYYVHISPWSYNVDIRKSKCHHMFAMFSFLITFQTLQFCRNLFHKYCQYLSGRLIS